VYGPSVIKRWLNARLPRFVLYGFSSVCGSPNPWLEVKDRHQLCE
jgi:hypothetical protein